MTVRFEVMPVRLKWVYRLTDNYTSVSLPAHVYVQYARTHTHSLTCTSNTRTHHNTPTQVQGPLAFRCWQMLSTAEAVCVCMCVYEFVSVCVKISVCMVLCQSSQADDILTLCVHT